MKFPVIEIVDRYTIAVVKHEKTNGANQEELNFYLDQMKEANINTSDVKVIELIEHHSYVWSLEDDFKKYTVEHKYSLEEVGRRAIHVRNILNERYILKNRMAEVLNDPVREVKKYG